MKSFPPHLWVVLALLVLGVVVSASACLRPQWMGGSSKLLEGFIEGNTQKDDDDDNTRKMKRSWDENQQYRSSAERLRDLQGLHMNKDMHDQYETIQKQLDAGEEVSVSAIYDFYKSHRELERYNQGYELDFHDRIRQKIARGEYITEEELDELKNRKGHSNSPYWNKPHVNKYLDEYSIDEYNNRMNHVMPSHYARGSSRHISRPSRDDMRKGGVLDSAFTQSFRDSPSELMGDTHHSSNASPHSYLLTGGDNAAPYQTTSLANPSSNNMGFNLPAHNDPYALEGISRSQIPPGEEDKYILKSKIVPPVCPACPNVCPKEKGECPPCPPCERCPNPDVECRKVTNYTKGKKMPMPILNDFSQFDM
jgi:hypothetical protein